MTQSFKQLPSTLATYIISQSVKLLFTPNECSLIELIAAKYKGPTQTQIYII